MKIGLKWFGTDKPVTARTDWDWKVRYFNSRGGSHMFPFHLLGYRETDQDRNWFRADHLHRIRIRVKCYADEPGHEKNNNNLWPWSLFPEADRNRARSVYTAIENRFETRSGQVLHNKFWTRWNIMQMTPNTKNTSDPDLFFQRRVGIERVQYTQQLKIVSRPEAGRFYISSSDPDEILCRRPRTWKIPDPDLFSPKLNRNRVCSV